MIFINFSNHPVDQWDDKQRNEALLLGNTIEDLPFPVVPESATMQEIHDMADNYLAQIKARSNPSGCIIHIMGEMTFTFAMVNILKKNGYTCVASTTKRIVQMEADGTKNVKFEFYQFREY